MKHEKRARAAGFLAEERGTLTMEFVCWLPLLLFWMIGTVALFEGYSRRNEAAKAHYTVTDALSRSETASHQDMASFHALYELLTPSFPRGEVMRITQIAYIEVDGEMVYAVDWSCAFPRERDEDGNVVGIATYDHDDVPVGLMPSLALNQRILLVQSAVPYVPAFTLSGLIESRLLDFDTITRLRRVPALELTSTGDVCDEPPAPVELDDSIFLVEGDSEAG